MTFRRLFAVAAIAFSTVGLLSAQSVTGSIVGSVKDSSGLPVARGQITLTQAATGAMRETVTNDRGDFVFSSLPPGEYNLTVKAEGFKAAGRNSIMLTASEKRSAGDIALEVGAVSESVTVTAHGAAVQTASSERAGLITSSQIDGIQVKGRNPMSLLALMPGVSTPTDPDIPNRNVGININGGRINTLSATLDGMGINQAGAANGLMTVSQDAVAELKVLLVGYPAEYGRFSGANVQVITKSGTRDFHGRASYFKRHEEFNANSFFNNQLGQKKPVYRYNAWNYSIGGPIYIPGKFNRDRNKLFFFWSQEFWPVKSAGALHQVTTPTELERAGNFSQTVDLNNRVIAIKDPLTGQPFAGNIVPPSRVDPSGRALLNSFPLPNFSNRAISGGRYNYVEQGGSSQPLRFATLKLDYYLSPKHQISSSLNMYTEKADGFGTSGTGTTNWNVIAKTFQFVPKQQVIRYTGIHSPTLVHELTLGVNGGVQQDADISADSLKSNQRSTFGFIVGQFAPYINPLGILPNVTFGGVTGSVNRNIDGRFLYFRQTNLGFQVSDNWTKTQGTHTIKAGILAERLYISGTQADQYFGNYDFTPDANNPLDTGHAYANASTGVFKSYTEANARPWSTYWNTSVEWFLQDSWKVRNHLTLEYGLRFYRLGYVHYRSRLVSGFVPDRYKPAQAVRLIAPALVGGKQVGRDPVSGSTYPAAAIGAIVPNSGNQDNGMVVPAFDPDYPAALVNNPGVEVAPRFGFAWDPIGKGKTSVRGAFGIFYNRQDAQGSAVPQTPILKDPVLYYGTFKDLLSSSGFVFPGPVTGWDPEVKTPRVMNLHLSIQQDIGFGTVVDVGYVGSLGRNLLWQRLLDPIPLGANFDPANANPANPRSALSPAFLRQYKGYNGVSYFEWASSSNYHALQATANRRFARSLEFGVSWTWSKAMGYNDTNAQTVSSLVPVRVWNYAPASYDRTHLFKLNWLWSVPSTPWRTGVLDRVFNGWQVSGIASFLSGAPLSVGYTLAAATDITGSPDQAARIVVTGDPVLPKGERSFQKNFRTDVFRAPAVGTVGNAAPSILRGPGVNNWDISGVKEIRLRERMRFQVRLEMYNAFNHTQFSAWNATARFDASGNQVNAQLGQATGARLPRQMQLALKFLF